MVGLVDTDEKMVVIARYGDVRRADFALSVLLGHEIDGYIDVPHVASMFPHLMIGSEAGIALYVRDSDAERATAVLNHAGPALQEEPEEPSDS